MKIKFYLDGDMICALLGTDIQSGVAGFGVTVAEAVENWLVEWNKLSAVAKNTHMDGQLSKGDFK